MSAGASGRLAVAPVFIIADEDRDAIEHISRRLPIDWFFVAVWEPDRVVPTAQKFDTTAVFLSDELSYPEGGSARLLQSLVDGVRKPVVILTEAWSPELRESWIRMGAADCIPHPTRFDRRMDTLKNKMQEFAADRLSSRSEADFKS